MYINIGLLAKIKTMIKKLYYLFVLFLIPTFSSFAQENDDMYFNKKDRVAKKVKKISPAETILSRYRSGITRINNSDKINSDIISKYRSNVTINKNLSNKSNKKIKSLKYDRDNLFRSKNFSKRLLDLNTFMMYGRIRPSYYYMMNPYDISFFGFNGITSYNNLWMPRNLYGIRALAAYDPMMFFSNPYLTSINPMMSPSLFNIHHPGISTYGLCNWTQMKTYPNWIWTNNGTGGGLTHTPGNNHMYISGLIDNNKDKVVVKGPRGGRGGVILKDNFDGVDRYVGRRESGITNKNIQRDNDKSIDETQNAYFRDRQSGRDSNITRSGRINYNQNSNRRSDNLNRSYSSRVNAINNVISNNSERSLRGSGSGYYSSNNNGRRGAYSKSSNYSSSRSGISNIGNRTKPYSGGSRNSSFSSSGSSSNSYGGGATFSGRSSGGGSTVSAGSSGGSSRGRNN